MIDNQLREAILKSGRSFYSIGQGSGTAQPVVSRFVRGKRGITLEVAARIAEHLGLRLTTRPMPRKSRGNSAAGEGGI